MKIVCPFGRTYNNTEYGSVLLVKSTNPILGQLKIFDDRIISIILYGSVARGTDTPESDIDVAVIVKSALSPLEEDALSDAVVEMNLKYDKVFSVIDIEADTIDKWGDIIPFYKNVRREGVVLWKTA